MTHIRTEHGLHLYRCEACRFEMWYHKRAGEDSARTHECGARSITVVVDLVADATSVRRYG